MLIGLSIYNIENEEVFFHNHLLTMRFKVSANNFRFSTLMMLLSFCFTAPPAHAEVTYSIPLTGVEHQIGNMLEWSTAIEDNSMRFIVEKSIDGIHFDNIGVIEAAGVSSSEKSYRYLDINASDKKSFYRLKQMDLDGTGSFSQAILVDKVLTNEFMVVSMSNTTTNALFELNLDAINEGQLSYSIVSLKGEKILEGQHQLEFGLNSLEFNFEDEKEGVYKINLQKEDELETLVIRKIDDEIKKKENVASKGQSNGG